MAAILTQSRYTPTIPHPDTVKIAHDPTPAPSHYRRDGADPSCHWRAYDDGHLRPDLPHQRPPERCAARWQPAVFWRRVAGPGNGVAGAAHRARGPVVCGVVGRGVSGRRGPGPVDGLSGPAARAIYRVHGAGAGGCAGLHRVAAARGYQHWGGPAHFAWVGPEKPAPTAAPPPAIRCALRRAATTHDLATAPVPHPAPGWAAPAGAT